MLSFQFGQKRTPAGETDNKTHRHTPNQPTDTCSFSLSSKDIIIVIIIITSPKPRGSTRERILGQDIGYKYLAAPVPIQKIEEDPERKLS